MSNRQDSNIRTIHPRALRELGEKACIVALGVARDLRSGVIPREQFNQRHWCGSACCIAGHISSRMGIHHTRLLGDIWDRCNYDLYVPNLFMGAHPSIPTLAADAIERYVYDGSETPWNG